MILLSLALQTAQPRFDDYRDMLRQLGVRAVRPGPNPNNQSTFDEATANVYAASMPDVLTRTFAGAMMAIVGSGIRHASDPVREARALREVIEAARG